MLTSTNQFVFNRTYRHEVYCFWPAPCRHYSDGFCFPGGSKRRAHDGGEAPKCCDEYWLPSRKRSSSFQAIQKALFYGQQEEKKGSNETVGLKARKKRKSVPSMRQQQPMMQQPTMQGIMQQMPMIQQPMMQQMPMMQQPMMPMMQPMLMMQQPMMPMVQQPMMQQLMMMQQQQMMMPIDNSGVKDVVTNLMSSLWGS
jgi:hypothetical protein